MLLKVIEGQKQSLFKTTLKLSFYSKPSFKLFVIPPIKTLSFIPVDIFYPFLLLLIFKDL